MKNLILCGVFAVLFGCSEQTKNDNLAQEAHASVSEAVSSIQQIELSEDEAYAFAQDLFMIIENDEKLLKEAFAQKDYEYILKYEHMDLNQYTKDVYLNQLHVRGKSEYPYFPDSENLDPYLVCDNALMALFKYSMTMSFYTRDQTETLKKIMYKQRDEYERDKSKCEKRVNMSYEQAYADYEK